MLLLRFLLRVYNLYFSPDRMLARRVRQMTGFVPARLSIFKLAFSHKSSQRSAGGDSTQTNNERLEYLGDAVLGTVVAEYLFKKYPDTDEGFLTKMRSKIVKRKSLNHIGDQMGLDVLLAEFNRTRLSASMLGNAVEALVGAVYLEKGYHPTKRFIIQRMLKNYVDIHELETVDDNYKSQLLEYCQKNGKSVGYQLVRKFKQDRRDRFKVAVLVGGKQVAVADDFNKKAAEQLASLRALEKMGVLDAEAAQAAREKARQTLSVARAATAPAKTKSGGKGKKKSRPTAAGPSDTAAAERKSTSPPPRRRDAARREEAPPEAPTRRRQPPKRSAKPAGAVAAATALGAGAIASGTIGSGGGPAAESATAKPSPPPSSPPRKSSSRGGSGYLSRTIHHATATAGAALDALPADPDTAPATPAAPAAVLPTEPVESRGRRIRALPKRRLDQIVTTVAAALDVGPGGNAPAAAAAGFAEAHPGHDESRPSATAWEDTPLSLGTETVVAPPVGGKRQGGRRRPVRDPAPAQPETTRDAEETLGDWENTLLEFDADQPA